MSTSKQEKTNLPSGWDRLTCFKYSFTCFEIETSDSICNWQVDHSSSFNIISLDPRKCFKHAGLHLKQVILCLPFDSFYSFFMECLDVTIQHQTYDDDILENCGNEMLSAVLLTSVSLAGQSNLSQTTWGGNMGNQGPSCCVKDKMFDIHWLYASNTVLIVNCCQICST